MADEIKKDDDKVGGLSVVGGTAAALTGATVAAGTTYGLAQLTQRDSRLTDLKDQLSKGKAALESNGNTILQNIKDGETTAARQVADLKDKLKVEGLAQDAKDEINKTLKAIRPLEKIENKITDVKDVAKTWADKTKGYASRLGTAASRNPLLTLAIATGVTVGAIKAMQYFGRDEQSQLNGGNSVAKA